MSKFRKLSRNTQHMLLKTMSYYLMHIMVASAVGYLVTGSVITAITLSLLEPTVQAIAYFFHEKAWARRAQRPRNDAGSSQAVPDQSRAAA